jgi:hypothetical protein
MLKSESRFFLVNRCSVRPNHYADMSPDSLRSRLKDQNAWAFGPRLDELRQFRWSHYAWAMFIS